MRSAHPRRAPRRVLRHLRLEARALVNGVGQLGEAVGELAARDEELEPLHEARALAVRLGERADLDGMV